MSNYNQDFNMAEMHSSSSKSALNDSVNGTSIIVNTKLDSLGGSASKPQLHCKPAQQQ